MPTTPIGWSRPIARRFSRATPHSSTSCARKTWLLATDLMVPFAHWITPEVVPKRFDTHFFLIAAPVDQLGAHDGGESVEGFWITPQQALREAKAGTRTLVFATRMNLTSSRAIARWPRQWSHALTPGCDGHAESNENAAKAASCKSPPKPTTACTEVFVEEGLAWDFGTREPGAQGCERGITPSSS